MEFIDRIMETVQHGCKSHVLAEFYVQVSHVGPFLHLLIVALGTLVAQKC